MAEVAGGACHDVDLGAAVAPQRMHVEIALQLGDEFVAFAYGEGRLLLELVEKQSRARGGDLRDDRRRLRADAVQLLRCRRRRERRARPRERPPLGAPGRRGRGRAFPFAIEQVGDTFERLCGLIRERYPRRARRSTSWFRVHHRHAEGARLVAGARSSIRPLGLPAMSAGRAYEADRSGDHRDPQRLPCTDEQARGRLVSSKSTKGLQIHARQRCCASFGREAVEGGAGVTPADWRRHIAPSWL